MLDIVIAMLDGRYGLLIETSYMLLSIAAVLLGITKIYRSILGRNLVNDLPLFGKCLAKHISSELTLDNKPLSIRSQKIAGWVEIAMYCMFTTWFWMMGAAQLLLFAMLDELGLKATILAMFTLLLIALGRYYYVQAHRVRLKIIAL